MSLTARALWYIESHLNSDLSLDEIAGAVHVSRFHLSRAFAMACGRPVAAYVRGRRLSVAASALAAGAPDILAVALDAGYGSHEAFTRAFRQQFGCTPERVRTEASVASISLQEPLRMNPNRTAPLAPPRIVKGQPLLISGLSEHYACSPGVSIPSQWNRFVAHLGHIPGQVGYVTYGVIYNPDDAGNYDYLCGVEVSEFPTTPAEFTHLRIPAQTYAVFEHREHISTIASTIGEIWNRGLADPKLQAADGAMFERYDERFNPRTGLGVTEIWVPVQS